MKFKRKKNIKFRGQKTHGYGSMKKHRGAGSRGGRGNAGSGKRADTKRPSIWKDTEYFGRHGFVSKCRTDDTIITITDINRKCNGWLMEGKASKNGNAVRIDLKALGYTKLLSNGKPIRAFSLTISKASAQAKEKIQQTGGTVTLDEEQA
ncbi:MAG: uL15m family ribosomal protein [archaeon]